MSPCGLSSARRRPTRSAPRPAARCRPCACRSRVPRPWPRTLAAIARPARIAAFEKAIMSLTNTNRLCRFADKGFKPCPSFLSRTFTMRPAAVARLEAIAVAERLRFCPKCGNADPKRHYTIKGKTARPGLRTCAGVPQAIHRQGRDRVRVQPCAAAQVVSGRAPSRRPARRASPPHQLHRTLERDPTRRRGSWRTVSREAMRSGELAPFGFDGGVVEIDETFIGKRSHHQAAWRQEGSRLRA